MDMKKIALLVVVIAIVLFSTIYLMFGSCTGACMFKGFSSGTCRNAPVIPDSKPCLDDETAIGATFDCNAGNLVGAWYSCCCK